VRRKTSSGSQLEEDMGVWFPSAASEQWSRSFFWDRKFPVRTKWLMLEKNVARARLEVTDKGILCLPTKATE
jgi:hypothetical protein